MQGPLAMFVEHWNWPEAGSVLDGVGCFMEKPSLQYADKLLASSRHTADYCQRAYGVDTSGAGVVYSGIDVNRFIARSAAGGDERSPRILFVGGPSGGEGRTGLVGVVARFKARFPRIAPRAFGRPDVGKR